jgi:hypothetical protein
MCSTEKNDITNHLHRTGEITKAQLKFVFSALANLLCAFEQFT